MSLNTQGYRQYLWIRLSGVIFMRSIVGEWVSEVNTDCLVQEKLGKIPPSSIERYSSAVQGVRP